MVFHSAGMQSISCDLGNFSRKGTKTQLLQYLLPGPGFAVRASAGSIPNWIGSATLRFMIVLVHSAGMQSMFWGARDFSIKRTKTQVQHHLLAGPGFAIMASAGSIDIA